MDLLLVNKQTNKKGMLGSQPPTAIRNGTHFHQFTNPEGQSLILPYPELYLVPLYWSPTRTSVGAPATLFPTLCREKGQLANSLLCRKCHLLLEKLGFGATQEALTVLTLQARKTTKICTVSKRERQFATCPFTGLLGFLGEARQADSVFSMKSAMSYRKNWGLGQQNGP